MDQNTVQLLSLILVPLTIITCALAIISAMITAIAHLICLAGAKIMDMVGERSTAQLRS